MGAPLEGKTVLITGGTGSFGKAFVRRVLKDQNPAKVIVFSRDELKQWEMQQELSDDRLRFFIGDVRDHSRLHRAFNGVDVVVHAAALKQVPAAEYNPFEFIKTNVTGSQNVVDAAIERGVERVVALSTDKACAPVTAYGTTKALMEHVFRAGQSYSTKTVFACTRYGNVAGSRGSVIQAWKDIISAGGRSVPVTHPDMTRFFFSLESAVDLCLHALHTSRGGELFVPKMGSFRIVDLAAAMKVDYHVVGVRGVEKLHEVMVSADEVPYFVEQPNHYVRGSGVGVPATQEYSSLNNSVWMSPEDLRSLVHGS